MEKIKYEQGMIDFIAYMVTSARNLLDEPDKYGPLRLMEGVSRLCALLSEYGFTDNEFLLELKENIDQRKFSVMTDMEDFVDLMDETVLYVTNHLLGAD